MLPAYISANDLKKQDEIERWCRRPYKIADEDTEMIVLVPCRSASCPCEYCRMCWAKKKRRKVQKSVKSDPVDYFCTLKYTNLPWITPEQGGAIHSKFSSTIRQRKSRAKKLGTELRIDTLWVYDFQTTGIDIHIGIKTSLKEEYVARTYFREIIQKASGDQPFRFHLSEFRNQYAIARYLFGDVQDTDDKIPPPEEWIGKRRYQASRHFF